MGNQDGVQGPSLAAVLGSLADRLTVIERSLAAVKTPAFVDLADYGGQAEPTSGQVPAYDPTIKRWVPGAAGGVQGDYLAAYSSTSVLSATLTRPVWTLDNSVGTSITLDGSGNPVLNVVGWYQMSIQILFDGDAGAGNYRAFQVDIPDGTGSISRIFALRKPMPSAPSAPECSPPSQMFYVDGVNDTVPYTISSMQVQQDSGATVTLGIGRTVWSYLRINRLA